MGRLLDKCRSFMCLKRAVGRSADRRDDVVLERSAGWQGKALMGDFSGWRKAEQMSKQTAQPDSWSNRKRTATSDRSLGGVEPEGQGAAYCVV